MKPMKGYATERKGSRKMKKKRFLDWFFHSHHSHHPHRHYPHQHNPHRHVTRAPVGTCSGTKSITATSTPLGISDGPANYENSQDCSWSISSSTGGSIRIRFTAFKTETGSDVLKVYDGARTTDPLLVSHSGPNLPSPRTLTSTGTSMLIKFSSDSSQTEAGFSATFVAGAIQPPAYYALHYNHFISLRMCSATNANSHTFASGLSRWGHQSPSYSSAVMSPNAWASLFNSKLLPLGSTHHCCPLGRSARVRHSTKSALGISGLQCCTSPSITSSLHARLGVRVGLEFGRGLACQ